MSDALAVVQLPMQKQTSCEGTFRCLKDLIDSTHQDILAAQQQLGASFGRSVNGSEPRYQHRNLADLDFPDFEEDSDDQQIADEEVSESVGDWAVARKHRLSGWPNRGRLPAMSQKRATSYPRGGATSSRGGAASSKGGGDGSAHRACEEEEPKVQPSLTRYFIKTNKFMTTSVLEESVIDCEIFKQVKIIKSFHPKFIEELLKFQDAVRAIIFMPNKELVCQGEYGDFLGVLAKGEADVIKDGEVVKHIREGDSYGGRCFIGVHHHRRATVKATTFCDVRLIYREAFQRCVDAFPALHNEFKKCQLHWHKSLEGSEDQAFKAMRKYTARWARSHATANSHPVSPGDSWGTHPLPPISARRST